MPGDLGSAVFELKTDSSKFDAGVDSAEAKTGKLTKTLGAAGNAGRILGGIAAGTLVGALSDVANAAAEDDASTARLAQSIENSGLSYAKVADEVEAAITRGQDLAFTDDQIRDALSTLVSETGSYEEAQKRLTLAQDFARGANIDLHTASKLLGKVTDENVNVLARYGIHVEKGSDATVLFGAVQQKFSGQAEAYGNTTAAAIFKVHDQIDEWRESIGHVMGPAQGLIALMPGVSSGMSLAGGAIGALSTVIRGPMISSFLATIPATIAMMVPFAPLILAIAAIGAAALALKWAWDNNFGDIQGKTAAVFGFLGGAFEAIKGTISAVWGAIGPIVQAGASAIIAPIQTVIGIVQGALNLLSTFAGASANSQTFNSSAGGVTTGDGTYIPLYAAGTDFVPNDGPAILHRGEAVLTRDENAARLTRTSGGPVEIPVYLDGREIARAVGDFSQRRTGLIGRSVV